MRPPPAQPCRNQYNNGVPDRQSGHPPSNTPPYRTGTPPPDTPPKSRHPSYSTSTNKQPGEYEQRLRGSSNTLRGGNKNGMQAHERVSRATNTAIAAATGTATACTVNFPDNQPGDTFYEYIQCLACRHIVTGFPDGLFHAERNITRGQISKMVSNSAGFFEDPGAQIYDDVPPGSPYYTTSQVDQPGHHVRLPCPDALLVAALRQPGDIPQR